MAVRNCLLAPSKAPNPSQRLEQCLRDCFGSLAPSAPTASEGLSRHLTSCLGRTLFLWPSETAFWHPQRLLTPRSASSSASATASEGLSRTASKTASEGLSRHHSVFMAVRNCLLAPSKAPNPSQRLEQCLRDCFGSSASWTALEGLSRHLTSCLGRTLF